MKSSILFSSCLCLLLLGCGGGGGSSSSGPSTPIQPLVDTKDLVAERDFTFTTERTISVDLAALNLNQGAMHVFTQVAHTTPEGRHIADPTSLLTTLYLDKISTVDLLLNNNIDNLYIQWTPMHSGQEQTWELALSSDQVHYLFQP